MKIKIVYPGQAEFEATIPNVEIWNNESLLTRTQVLHHFLSHNRHVWHLAQHHYQDFVVEQVRQIPGGEEWGVGS